MHPNFLIYGANGFVGREIAAAAVSAGLHPVLGGRNAGEVQALAQQLGLESRVFGLDDPEAVQRGLAGMAAVLHCAGPFIHTWRPVASACLAVGAHYLDITGELPVYQGLHGLDDAARQRKVMLLPGAGFDVVPSDCLALHLKQRLPSATHLELAFRTRGPAPLPPGTRDTMLTLLPHGVLVRRDGRIQPPQGGGATRQVDFGAGPVTVTRMTWGDIFTAYFSTGIPNITNYLGLPPALTRMMGLAMAVKPLFRLGFVRSLSRRLIPAGSTPAQRARSSTLVWGEVRDERGGRAAATLRGPEAGVDWTVITALACVRRVLDGEAPPGYQTPAKAYGTELVMSGPEVERVVV